MRYWTTLPGLLLLLGQSSQQPLAQDRPPVIDMHLHARNSVSGGARPCNSPSCEGMSRIAVSDDDPFRLTVEAMDRYNIVLGFLSDSLDNVFKWVEAAPGRFIASPSVRDPGAVDLRRLRREYEAGRLRGMGELGVQYMGIAADDPRVEPFFALADEFDVPVLVHAHGTGAPSKQFRIDIGRPTRIEEVLVRHPTLRLSIETSGFPFLEETIALMYRYPNVYGDLSPWKYPREIFEWYLRRLLDAGLGKRLMFGSDQTEFPELIGESIEALESIPFLTEEQRRDIFCGNAARFLRLDPVVCQKRRPAV